MKDLGFLESPRPCFWVPRWARTTLKSNLAVSLTWQWHSILPLKVVLFPRPTRNPEGEAANWDWCWHQGLGPSLAELPPNTKINRQKGDLARFPNSRGSLNPQSLKRHTPDTRPQFCLSSAPATGSGSLDRPCQRNPPQLWHPFLQPKGQLRPR